MTRCWTPSMLRSATNTHGSDSHCLNPHSRSQGKRDRCQRRPACAIPYTGFSMRQMRGRPSAPYVE
eukprot:3979919-Pleurochrysis_carterae.AAC.1